MIYDRIKTDKDLNNIPSTTVQLSSAMCYMGYEDGVSGRVSLKLKNSDGSVQAASQNAVVTKITLKSVTNLNYQVGDIFSANDITAGEYTITISKLGGIELKGKGMLLYLNDIPANVIINFGGNQIINTTNEGYDEPGNYCAAFCNLQGTEAITCLSVWKTPEGTIVDIPTGEDTPLTFRAKAGVNAVQLNAVGQPDSVNLQYTKDYVNWTEYTIGDVIELNQNDVVAFSGNNNHFSKDSQNYYNFAMTGIIQAMNNIQSLINYSDSVTNSCYWSLFANCSSLVTPPELPATNLSYSCYKGIFHHCSSLITTPQLPAMQMFANCYEAMFAYCTSLTLVPQDLLPATTLANSCYYNMFYNCTSLTAAPVLPATELATTCYLDMFYNCTSLTAAPELPATTLTTACYAYMFYKCTSLTDAPTLPATTLAPSCYCKMFYDCTNLSSIDIAFTQWPDDSLSATLDWVNGVQTTSGTFYKSNNLSTEYGNDRIPTNWGVLDVTPLTFTAKSATNAIQLNQVGSPDPIQLKYRKNNSEWAAYAAGDLIELNQNQTIAFSGANDYFSKDADNYYNFVMTGSIQSYGNIQSLMNYSDNAPAYCYRSLFNGCSSLLTAPQLSATTLADYCYHVMFKNCTSLTSVPSLPATTLANSCYQYMFGGCTSLSTAPQNLLPVTSAAPSCYAYMFIDCTSLTTAPELPATTLAEGCYRSMFSFCTSLTDAPSILPATRLAKACYYWMFRGCTSLTAAPYLPATTLSSGCYGYMFYGCSNLSSINVAFTSWTEADATTNWVDGVAANGTFTCPASLGTNSTITRGTSNCPTNWTVTNT